MRSLSEIDKDLDARESDAKTGLYYYRARYYDQSAGRFLREDPLRFTGGVNFYVYVRNRPTNMADRFGLWPSAGEIWTTLKGLWDTGKGAWDKTKGYADKITCVVKCVNCVNPWCENSKSIGKAQGTGGPVLLPGDLLNQGNPDYVGAPLASEGFRQLQMAGAGNKNCKDCINDCLTAVPAMGMFPSPPAP
ncbi:MAG TPA: RHS repeat-associated core domain-containing protein [Candidatus Angelobacter sp.]|nr:RHS repeat-associated core domain-containing protein [Candidatus Angelobacter sp.]